VSNVDIESRVARAIPMASAALDPSLPRAEQVRQILAVFTLLAGISEDSGRSIPATFEIRPNPHQERPPMITMPTTAQIEDHLEECCDGSDCKLLTAQALAESVAAPGHVTEVRDLIMSLHLAEVGARDHLENVQLLTTVLAAVVRRAPGRMLTVEREELIERVDKLVVEQRDDDGIDLAVVHSPDGGHTLS